MTVMPNTPEKVVYRTKMITNLVRKEFIADDRVEVDIALRFLELLQFQPEAIDISMDEVEHEIYMSLVSQIALYFDGDDPCRRPEPGDIRLDPLFGPVVEHIVQCENTVDACGERLAENPISSLVMSHVMTRSAIAAGMELKRIM